MRFSLLLTLVALALLAALAGDIVTFRRKLAGQPPRATNNERISDALLLFCPFLAFVYPETFWFSFTCLMVLYLLGCGAQWGAYRLGGLPSGPLAALYLGFGMVVLNGLGYFLFLHEGPIAEAPPDLAPPDTTGDAMRWWPFAAYPLAMGCCLLAARREAAALGAVLGSIATLTVLPFFTGYYWWSLGLGGLVFLSLLDPLLRSVARDARGGLSFVAVYMAQLALVASIAVYAFLF